MKRPVYGCACVWCRMRRPKRYRRRLAIEWVVFKMRLTRAWRRVRSWVS